jgi:hypothetical protein
VRQRTAERWTQLLKTLETYNEIKHEEEIQGQEPYEPVKKYNRVVGMNLCCVIIILLLVIGLLIQKLMFAPQERVEQFKTQMKGANNPSTSKNGTVSSCIHLPAKFTTQTCHTPQICLHN